MAQKQKINEKLKTKISSEETVWASLWRQSGKKKWNYGGEGFVKQENFKLWVKERGSYGWAEW